MTDEQLLEALDKLIHWENTSGYGNGTRVVVLGYHRDRLKKELF